jgi:hypothetical protein
MEPQDLQALVKVNHSFLSFTSHLTTRIQRANFLRNNPQEQKKTGELDSLIKHIQLLSSQGRWIRVVH